MYLPEIVADTGDHLVMCLHVHHLDPNGDALNHKNEVSPYFVLIKFTSDKDSQVQLTHYC